MINQRIQCSCGVVILERQMPNNWNWHHSQVVDQEIRMHHEIGHVITESVWRPVKETKAADQLEELTKQDSQDKQFEAKLNFYDAEIHALWDNVNVHERLMNQVMAKANDFEQLLRRYNELADRMSQIERKLASIEEDRRPPE